MGTSAQWLDKEVIENAAEAVLHYFKSEKGQHSVSVAEFSEVLERVLRGLGLDVKSGESDEDSSPEDASDSPHRVVEANLQELATQAAEGWELLFFARLREAVRNRLDGAPVVLQFRGLRACVKQLTGARRWSPHCQKLNDHIVEYLRTCLTAEKQGDGCTLVIR
jgi:hypothetical protein